jgi:hypothetical protein
MHSPAAAEQQPEYAEMQALVAKLYALSEADFRYVLGTFPLISDEVEGQDTRSVQRSSLILVMDVPPRTCLPCL